MMERHDYYVLDQYDDVWNSEPINTFKNAWDWRNFIRPLLNRDSKLRIESVPRGSEHIFVPRSIERIVHAKPTVAVSDICPDSEF